jgi:two-component system chemotaxis response regulator CheV
VARKQMSLTLKKGGYDVVEAEDGQEAADLLTRMAGEAEAAGRAIGDDLLLVISDVEMPRMDGYSLVSTIKANEHLRLLPVILHSSLSGQDNIDRARRAGCDEYMVKFDPHLLLQTVEKLAGAGRNAGTEQ